MNIPTAANARYMKKQMIPLATAQANRQARELRKEKAMRVQAMIEARRNKTYNYGETDEKLAKP